MDVVQTEGSVPGRYPHSEFGAYISSSVKGGAKNPIGGVQEDEALVGEQEAAGE